MPQPPVDQHPDFARWVRAQRPRLKPRVAARIEHTALCDELATIDGELEVLAARRRRCLAGLQRVRSTLWPGVDERHGRRPPMVDQPPIAPVPEGATALGGVDLRTVALGVLRRHGPLPLRELHSLLHRHGYEIDGENPVKGLADAMAYEVRMERCVRVARGVYGAVSEEVPRGGVDAEVAWRDPLAWDDPDEDAPQADPVLVDDPERWSGGRWDPPVAADDLDLWDRFVDESHPTVRNWVRQRGAWRRRAAGAGGSTAGEGGDDHEPGVDDGLDAGEP